MSPASTAATSTAHAAVDDEAGSGVETTSDITVVPSLHEFVAELQSDFPERVRHVETLAARPARFGELDRPFPSEVADRLGVDQLWSHQAEAMNLIRNGVPTVLATGTASGKTLCYAAPIAEAVGAPLAPATALCIYPTKALAQDQLRAITAHKFAALTAATFDGDCSTEERSWVRNNANVVLTNPEMLHHSILANHRRWADFFHQLSYVVIDELHVFRGVFGSHVAQVIRRLRRLCNHYGSDPVFVFCSATIGEPERLATALCGEPVTAVTTDGSPKGERLFVLWNPAVTDPETNTRSSARSDSASLTAELVTHGYRSITFCRSRRITEVIAADVRDRLPEADRELVRSYRGGYLPAERRDLEAEFFSGSLRAMVTTSALELGVDVGGLDACVINGFPGTVASLWQQAGRAGRTSGTSLTTLVAGDDQLDQWMMNHPRELFTRAPEPAVANPHNPEIRDPHLVCAAFELPLTHDDQQWWGDGLDDGIRNLVQADRVAVRDRRGEPAAVWAGGSWPAAGIGLRSSSSATIQIETTTGELVGTVDESGAYAQVHTGARYLHQGRGFVVDTLDLERRRAVVVPDDADEYTQAKSETAIRILEVDDQTSVGSARLGVGAVEVTQQVTGYQRRNSLTRELIANVDLDLPATHLMTRGFWYVIEPAILEAARVDDKAGPGALHAAEHAGIGILPLFALCDRWDVGGVSTMWLTETSAPTIVIYDAFPGGAGVAELGFAAADRHLAATLEVIEGCRCEDGCPSCVQSPKCGNLNEPLDKAAAIRLLHAILGG